MFASLALSLVLSCAGTPTRLVQLHEDLVTAHKQARSIDERGFSVWRTSRGCAAKQSYAGTERNVWIPVAPLEGDTLLVVHTHPANDGPGPEDIEVAKLMHVYGIVLNVDRVWIITPRGKVFLVAWDEFRKAL